MQNKRLLHRFKGGEWYMLDSATRGDLTVFLCKPKLFWFLHENFARPMVFEGSFTTPRLKSFHLCVCSINQKLVNYADDDNVAGCMLL